MFYLTFTLPASKAMLEAEGFEVEEKALEGPFSAFQVVVAHRPMG
jgi:hypothetical protein